MGVSFRDRISPALANAAAGIQDKRPILEAMGTQLVSLTQRAFNEPGLRPAPWINKLVADASGHLSRSAPSNLRKNQVLVRSIRITKLTGSSVTVGTDRIQAAIHQLGGIIRAKGRALQFSIGGVHFMKKQVKMPARPFFPFIQGRMTAPAQEKIKAVGEAAIARLFKKPGA